MRGKQQANNRGQELPVQLQLGVKFLLDPSFDKSCSTKLGWVYAQDISAGYMEYTERRGEKGPFNDKDDS